MRNKCLKNGNSPNGIIEEIVKVKNVDEDGKYFNYCLCVGSNNYA